MERFLANPILVADRRFRVQMAVARLAVGVWWEVPWWAPLQGQTRVAGGSRSLRWLVQLLPDAGACDHPGFWSARLWPLLEQVEEQLDSLLCRLTRMLLGTVSLEAEGFSSVLCCICVDAGWKI